MARGWPPLELREVIDILAVLGLTYSHSKGGHDFYKGVRHDLSSAVTVDPNCAPFSADLLQFMCKQARSNRQEFYGATKKTAVKIAKGKKR